MIRILHGLSVIWPITGWNIIHHSWWRHQMGTFSGLQAHREESSPHKGQWRWALMFVLISVQRNGWANNQDAGDLRCAHYVVTVVCFATASLKPQTWILLYSFIHKAVAGFLDDVLFCLFFVVVVFCDPTNSSSEILGWGYKSSVR